MRCSRTHISEVGAGLPKNLHCVLLLRGGGRATIGLEDDVDGGVPDDLNDANFGAEISSCNCGGHRCGKRCAGHGSQLDFDALGSCVYNGQCTLVGDGGIWTGRCGPEGRQPVYDDGCVHMWALQWQRMEVAQSAMHLQ